MKKTRKLIPAVAMLLMSTVMMSTASYAWFSMNAEVDVTGMSVKAEAAGSLIINDKYTDGKLSNKTSVNFTNATSELKPIAWLGTDTTELTDATYVYVSNTGDVAPGTGYADDEAQLEYLEVVKNPAEGETETKQTFAESWVDYIVYISAAGQQLDSQKLEATVTFTNPTLTQLAVSVDFWVGTAVSQAVTVSTDDANLPWEAASRKGTAIAANSNTYKVTLYDSVSIPVFNVESANNSIPVLMRVYFDGNAKDASVTTEDKAYVRSETANFEALWISIAFNATTVSQA